MKRSRPTTLEPISAAMFVIVSLHIAAAFGVWWWRQENGARQRNAGESQLAWMYPSDFKLSMPPAATPVSKPVAAAPKAAKITTAEPKKTDDPPVQKATLVAAPPQQHQMVPVPNESGTPLFASASPPSKPAANRSITLRRAPEKPLATTPFGSPAPPMASPTLLDIARLNTLRPTPPPPPEDSDAAAKVEVNLDAVDEAVNTAFLTTWTAPPIDAVPVAQREARLNISIGKDGTILKAQMSKFSGSHALDQSILEAAGQVKKISAALPSNFSKDSYDLELNFLLLP
ncbi:TonB C-terminal domain-containing protein [Prosthecobacter sp.]|uniref:TonB C-terminal domain-containing protein n=1 Tax=Prosthecobacter sp. TaxID=1965333 RepID=UPI002ABCF1AE|nr:TonB C-terminal domain-containing protein [Prosthecobacter sp.]MDZ4403717.1 TonB C-terminal domain-containing protein [Prosthecobacter sp.]